VEGEPYSVPLYRFPLPWCKIWWPCPWPDTETLTVWLFPPEVAASSRRHCFNTPISMSNSTRLRITSHTLSVQHTSRTAAEWTAWKQPSILHDVYTLKYNTINKTWLIQNSRQQEQVFFR
jgi:hypothetical protein